jgi:hypothetical protein
MKRAVVPLRPAAVATTTALCVQVIPVTGALEEVAGRRAASGAVGAARFVCDIHVMKLHQLHFNTKDLNHVPHSCPSLQRPPRPQGPFPSIPHTDASLATCVERARGLPSATLLRVTLILYVPLSWCVPTYGRSRKSLRGPSLFAHPFRTCSSLLSSPHLSRARLQVWYCSVECQKVHWKEGGHKKVCKATQAVVSKVVAPRGAAGATGFSSPALASGGATTAKKPSSSTTSASQSDGGVCTICLESDPPPIQSGCACRGDAGLAHIECRISAAAAKHQSTGNPAWWSKCTTCNEGLNGEIALGLAQEFYRRMQGHPDKEWGFAAIVLSNALGKVGKDAEAETLCRESLSVLEQPGRGGPAAAQLLRDLRCQLAHALANQGKHAEALPIEECCFEEALLQDGPDDATTLVSAKSIANFLIALDRNAEATTLLLDTYARAKREFGAERSFTLEIGVDLARSLMGSGKEAEGQAMLEELLPVLKRVLGPEHHVYLQSTRMYATSVFNSGRFVEGEAMLADVLKAEMRVLGDEHPQTRSTAETLAHVRKNLVRLGVHLAEAQRMQPAAHTTQ